jgi:sporulation protein YlmC with PRC-barrel domain
MAHEEIPTKGQVECTDGICGTIESVVIDPVEQTVTHIVVKTRTPAVERLVPVNTIASDRDGNIKLKLALAEVDSMPAFMEENFIRHERSVKHPATTILPYGAMGMPGFTGANAFYWPIAVPFGSRTDSYKHESIPAGQLALRRGTRVEATDGHVGTVDEIVVDPDTCTISYLVLRESRRKDIAVPYASISSTSEKTVYVNLSKKEVEALPAVELRRRWD